MGFTSALCQAEKDISGGNLPSCFIGAGTDSLEIGLSNGIGVDHYGSGGNDGLRLMVASVSGRILIWS